MALFYSKSSSEIPTASPSSVSSITTSSVLSLLFNKSALSEEFDSTDSQEIFKMFLEKIKNGTLEIRLTGTQNHAKAYILTNKEASCSLLRETP